MEPTLPPALREEIGQAFERICDLPFPIYASDKDGVFLFANEQAVEFFGLDPGVNLTDYKVGTFYEDPKEREYILRQLQQVSPGAWRSDLTVRLKIHDALQKIRFVSRPYFDEEGQLAGLLCIASSMSEIEWFAEFEEMIQAGFFEVNKSLIITDCNRTFSEMLGYGTPAELKGKSLREISWEPEKASELLRNIIDHPHLEHLRFKLLRRDGAMVIVKMNCIGVADETGSVARIKGTVSDITFEIIQNDLPAGLFLVSTNAQGEEIISRASTKFAQIHGYQSMNDILTLPISSFHSNPASYSAFKAELDKAAQNNQPLLDYFMEIQDKQGKRRNVVVNVCYAADGRKDLRVGAVYDVTDHLRGHMRTLETDFSSVLHTYIATINGLRDTLYMLMKAHGQDVQKDEMHIDRDRAAAETSSHKKRLEDQLAELRNIAEERGLAMSVFDRLQQLLMLLSKEGGSGKEKDNAAIIRRILIKFRKNLEELKHQNLPRELVRGLRSEVDEMLRLTSMISLSMSLDELNERIMDFNFFRDYLRRGDMVQHDMKRQNLVSILGDVVNYVAEFASVNRVSVNQHYNVRDQVYVNCHKTSLNRALHNLLHNAIKYSWSKGADRQAWIDIRMEKKPNYVEISIENWGVPIRKEELENGRIFLFGTRGRESDDRDRSGTGIGLYDATDIISKHGGSLRITSEPTFGNLPEVYTNPFITRAIVTLPTTT
ncbi:MAG: PAS domain-containing protein [Saprospiraceae bacterium]|nr:PAS domain-containing protein [Saprospiraceae bacterium]